MIVMDSCSVILLAKASVLETLADARPVAITKTVLQEVLKGKERLLEDALLLERLVQNQKIQLLMENLVLTKKISQDFNMGYGEASTIAVAMGKKNAIVATDNRQGRKVTKVHNLPLVGSPEIVVSLYKQKRITKEKASSALRVLQEQGWFSPYLLEKAKGGYHE